jgi:hypothetical protein
MSEAKEDTSSEPAQSILPAVLPIAAVLLVVASIFAFLKVGWFFGLCGLAIAGILYALAAILDLLEEIFDRVRRLEAKLEQKQQKP